jgi:hypothetical protein
MAATREQRGGIGGEQQRTKGEATQNAHSRNTGQRMEPITRQPSPLSLCALLLFRVEVAFLFREYLLTLLLCEIG